MQTDLRQAMGVCTMLSVVGRDAYRESQVQRLNQVRLVFLANAMTGETMRPDEVDWARRLGPDDTWESIRSVTHDARSECVDVLLELRSADGYGADDEVPATLEYLALYVDWGDGTGLAGAGIVATTVGNDERRRASARSARRVRLRLDLPPPRRAATPVVLRAILSWHEPPPRHRPEFRPVFGAVAEIHPVYHAEGGGLIR